jgi:hypothetical protein
MNDKKYGRSLAIKVVVDIENWLSEIVDSLTSKDLDLSAE